MSLSADIFSDIFARRDSVFTRLDPRLKILTALIAIGCVVASKNAVFPVIIFTGCFAGMVAVRIPLSLIALRLASPLGIVGTLIILQSALTKGMILWQVNLVFAKILFSKEGLLIGLLSGARVLGAVSVILFLSFITPAHQIFRSLHWLRVPKGWMEIAILMYRYLFTLLDLVADMTSAQRLRLGYRGWKRSLRSTAIVAGIVLLRSVDQATRTHDAMLLRGYNGVLPFGPMPLFQKKDRWRLVAASIVLVGISLLCQRSFA
jgi:cobalt/nickel transport system permease protein